MQTCVKIWIRSARGRSVYPFLPWSGGSSSSSSYNSFSLFSFFWFVFIIIPKSGYSHLLSTSSCAMQLVFLFPFLFCYLSRRDDWFTWVGHVRHVTAPLSRRVGVRCCCCCCWQSERNEICDRCNDHIWHGRDEGEGERTDIRTSNNIG
jgi:hypothetical protein